MNEQQTDLQEMLAANIAAVRASIAAAAQRVGRDVDEITLVAVSKTKPVEMVKIAYNLGITDFGENRVQDALPKIADFHPAGLRWHMIGHVQSNKVNKIVGQFDSVQSVDSLHLAQLLQQHAEALGIRLPILLQVNVSGEESKEGIALADAPEVARQILAFPQLEVQGLMTIAPLAKELEEVRPVFRGLRVLRDRLRDELPQYTWQHLSMGMTDDYTLAIEEGATIVRIGRAVFGERVHRGDKE